RSWQAHTSPIRALAFAPDGRVLASAGYYDHAIRRWDTATGEEIAPLDGHRGKVVSLFFRPDRKSLVTWADDREVVEWDLPSGRERQPAGPRGPSKEWRDWMLRTVSPDGKLAAWLVQKDSPNSAVRLWNVELGKALEPLGGHPGWIPVVRFSPDGKLLASGSED